MASGGLLGGVNTYAYVMSNALAYADMLGLTASWGGTGWQDMQDPPSGSSGNSHPPSIQPNAPLPIIPHNSPEFECRTRCYAAAIKGTAVEEAGLHALSHVSHIFHRVSHGLSMLGVGYGLYKLQDCLDECQKNHQCDP